MWKSVSMSFYHLIAQTETQNFFQFWFSKFIFFQLISFSSRRENPTSHEHSYLPSAALNPLSQENKYIYTNWRKILSAQYVCTKIWITNVVLVQSFQIPQIFLFKYNVFGPFLFSLSLLYLIALLPVAH